MLGGRFVALGGRVGRLGVTNIPPGGRFVAVRVLGGALTLTNHASVDFSLYKRDFSTLADHPHGSLPRTSAAGSGVALT